MADAFENYQGGLESPAQFHTLLSADANNDVNPRPRAIYCNEAGEITVVDKAGVSVAYAMSAGQVLPFRAVRISAISGGSFYGWS